MKNRRTATRTSTIHFWIEGDKKGGIKIGGGEEKKKKSRPKKQEEVHVCIVELDFNSRVYINKRIINGDNILLIIIGRILII